MFFASPEKVRHEILAELWARQQPAVIAEGFPFHEASRYEKLSTVKPKWYEGHASGLMLARSIGRGAGTVYPALTYLESQGYVEWVALLQVPVKYQGLIMEFLSSTHAPGRYRYNANEIERIVGETLPRKEVSEHLIEGARYCYFITENGREHVPHKQERRSIFGVPIPKFT